MDKAFFSKKILSWYGQYKRSLPWRGGSAYHVLVSEIMLQQTQVKTVIPFFHRFLDRFPTLDALAHSALDTVYQAWQGLGYYHRARYLHEAARAWVALGRDPKSYEEWRKFPGVGSYTGAALAAILLEQRVAAIDGNIKRILQRCFGLDTLAEISVMAQEVLPEHHYGDYTQGLMDLGASICTPRAPQCTVCPIAQHCKFKNGIWTPIIVQKAPKPVRYGHVYLCVQNHEIWTVKNTKTKLLKGLWGFPISELNKEHNTSYIDLAQNLMCGTVRHAFTHFTLILSVWNASSKVQDIISQWPQGIWLGPKQREAMGFSKLMRKVENAVEDVLKQ
ncbi:A/G-specific adenine glycosylase [Holospora curviuscula]|uniref:Adenine DNA glycosylase n=1 Tax=Holospora curviuscula TaxID=1082868 RepID=A0A2S5R9A0_9PROT|nr:A/G-specific adenine glycosylase [Holospora curviuscula]PPE03705.1 A/G-specific adenine glycosylase [Holospora curviuscula]